LTEWIKSDGLRCLKIKLKGTDSQWDYQRIVKVGSIAIATGVDSLSVDFNCTVKTPEYVNEILDRLKEEHKQIFDLILYVEQPFPYDIESNQIDVSSLSARKPLFLDESAHDWKFVELGRQLGWTGVALKTCKTQTGALLSLCWAKAQHAPHGARPHESDARTDSTRSTCRARGHDSGSRIKWYAVLSGCVRTRATDSPGHLPTAEWSA